MRIPENQPNTKMKLKYIAWPAVSTVKLVFEVWILQYRSWLDWLRCCRGKVCGCGFGS